MRVFIYLPCGVDVDGQAVELLVRQGADVTMVNAEGQTAVELASTSVIRQLLLSAVQHGGPQHNLCQAAWQGNADILHRVLVRSHCVSFVWTFVGSVSCTLGPSS